MKRAPLCAVLVLLGACGAPRKGGGTLVPPAAARRASQEPPEAENPNFVLVVSESVPNPDDDGVSFTKVFIDGKEVGKTAVGRKSEVRTLKLRLPPGNEPVRLEQWILPGVGEWARVEGALQPRERFVRVEDGTVVRLDLRFGEGEASHTVTLSRAAAGR